MIDSKPEPSGGTSQEVLTGQARVTSDIPGRMRLRIKRDRRHPTLLESVQQRLESHVGAGHVELNPTTHSILVRYDRRARSSDDVRALLRDLGVIIGETASALGDDLPDVAPGHTRTSESIVEAMSDLDRRIAHWTGHNLDLKLLFPLTLGGLGVWQLARRGIGLGDVPAYVLIWYAFDSFWKFHGQHGGDTQR